MCSSARHHAGPLPALSGELKAILPLELHPCPPGGEPGQQLTEEFSAVQQSCQPYPWGSFPSGCSVPKAICFQMNMWKISFLGVQWEVWCFLFCFVLLCCISGGLQECDHCHWTSLFLQYEPHPGVFSEPDILETTRDWFIQGMGLRHM